MKATEHTVKVFELSFEHLPGTTFKIQAETLEQAKKKLVAELRAFVKELTAKPIEPKNHEQKV